ncbi:hypothetical protein PUN28_015170 [Cardiocondyla obscurior]|uniref:Uncharacterized protein n=1 Tax=Cardiocondyla obscurior TaxID=286306 RepID=A0AAW2F2G8_9HYME
MKKCKMSSCPCKFRYLYCPFAAVERLIMYRYYFYHIKSVLHKRDFYTFSTS